MKKLIAILLALVMVLGLAACSVEKTPAAPEATPAPEAAPEKAPEAAPEATPEAPAVADAITLWTYPIGGWGQQDVVDALMADFEAATGIKVTVEYLTYADGDDKVNTAIEGNAAPDLIMEGPERLVANWGAKGKMVNIADLFDDTDKAELNPATVAACFADDATAYEYPLVMTAHCMAITRLSSRQPAQCSTSTKIPIPGSPLLTSKLLSLLFTSTPASRSALFTASVRAATRVPVHWSTTCAAAPSPTPSTLSTPGAPTRTLLL